MLRADGQDSPKPLTPPGFAQPLPSRNISPDGSRLALIKRATGRIVLVPTRGGPLTTIPVEKTGLIPICWSNDGQLLLGIRVLTFEVIPVAIAIVNRFTGGGLSP